MLATSRDSPGAHSQGATLDELNRNLAEVLSMLLKDGETDVALPVAPVENL